MLSILHTFILSLQTMSLMCAVAAADLNSILTANTLLPPTSQLHRSPIFCQSHNHHQRQQPQQYTYHRSIVCKERNSRIKVLETIYMSPSKADKQCSSTLQKTNNYSFAPKPLHKCIPKSIAGDQLACKNAIGQCNFHASPKPIKLSCGEWSNRFYVIYQCVPVALKRIARWQAKRKERADKASVHLSCPSSMIVIIDKAIAAMFDFVNEIKCPMQEAYTNQVARACHCAHQKECNQCAAPAIASNYWCRGAPIKNDIAFVDYFCLPAHYPSIARLDICSAGTVETSSVSEAFILTPHYPDRYGAQLNCTMKISQRHNHRALSIYVLDFDVLYGHSLTLTDSNGLVQTLYTTDSAPKRLRKQQKGDIVINFKSNMILGGRGMKLYFTVDEPLNMTSTTTRTIIIKKTNLPMVRNTSKILANRSLLFNTTNSRNDAHYVVLASEDMTLFTGVASIASIFTVLVLMTCVFVYCVKPLSIVKKGSRNRDNIRSRNYVNGEKIPHLLLNMSTDEDTSNEYERVQHFSTEEDYDYGLIGKSPQWTTCSQSFHRCTSCGKHFLRNDCVGKSNKLPLQFNVPPMMRPLSCRIVK